MSPATKRQSSTLLFMSAEAVRAASPMTGSSYRWVLLVVLIWFGAAHLFGANNRGLDYDGALNATVAKNFAQGAGWVNHYHQETLFDHRVTTGPALLLPTALVIALVGPQEWVPSVTHALLMILVLAAALWQLRYLSWPTAAHWCAAGLIIVLLSSLYEHGVWQELRGDGAIALILVNLALLLARARGVGHYAIAGMLAGLAMLAKLYAVIALSGAFAVWGLLQISEGNGRALPGKLLPLILGAAVVLVPWWLYESATLSALSPQELALRERQSRSFFLYFGSGIGQLLASDSVILHCTQNAVRNFHLLASHLAAGTRGAVAAAALLLAVVSVTSLALYRCLLGKSAAADRYLSLLGGALLAHLGWFMLFMYSAWDIYARIPVLLSIFFLPVAALHVLGVRSTAVFLLTFLLLVPVSAWSQWRQLALFEQAATSNTDGLLKLHAGLETLQYQGPLAGCGWLVVRELEFITPGRGHFKDCLRLVEENLAAAPIATGGNWPLTETLVFTLVINERIYLYSHAFYDQHSPEQVIPEKYCQQELARFGHYSVRQCRISSVSVETVNAIRRSLILLG